MKDFFLYLFIILRITVPQEQLVQNVTDALFPNIHHEVTEYYITSMEALDIVKKQYAANFDKVMEETGEQYYYKLSFAELYLVYEEEIGTDQDYLIHLYEFVVDDPETGMGHMVTYGWYTVDRITGRITEKME